MAVDLSGQAAAAKAQGEALLQSYIGNANQYKGTYNNAVTAADAANKNVQDYTKYMQGEGSAGNQFHGEMTKELGELGYSPEQMAAARGNLNAATGALSAYSDFANQAASKWGMNAGGFAAANAGALGSLNNNIASNQGVVNSLSDLYKTAQTGAGTFTGQVVAGQHETLAGLQSVFQNAASQRDSALSMLQFYEDLASKQGGLNAQQQQYYAAAAQAYAAANQAQQQAALLAQQIKQGQDYMNSPAYKSYLGGPATPATSASKPATPTPNKSGAGYSPTNPSSSWNAFTNTLGNNPSLGNTARGIGDLGAAGVSGLGWLGKKIWNGF